VVKPQRGVRPNRDVFFNVRGERKGGGSFTKGKKCNNGRGSGGDGRQGRGV